MTVAELIRELEKLDPTLPAVYQIDVGCVDHPDVTWVRVEDVKRVLGQGVYEPAPVVVLS